MYKKYRDIKIILSACLLVSLSISCNKKKTEEEEADADTSFYVVEAAVTAIGQMAYSVEAEEATLLSHSPYHSIEPSSIHLLSNCNYATARSACTNLQTTVDWNGCTLSNTSSSGTNSATLTGVITETYSGFGAASCLLTGDESNVKRLISNTNPWVLTFANNATLTRDMDPGTAFDGTTYSSASEGTSITRVESGTSNGLNCGNLSSTRCYQIIVNGLHTTFKGPRGRTWFEHILTSDVTFTGSKSNNNRTMAGSTSVWHELAQYKAVNTFNNVTWGNSTCCYPTSGSISTILTGSKTGSLTMTFSATCGEASFYNSSDESTTTIQLTQCSE